MQILIITCKYPQRAEFVSKELLKVKSLIGTLRLNVSWSIVEWRCQWIICKR